MAITSADPRTEAISRFRLRVNGVLSPFAMYGMDVYIPPVAKALEQLALELHSKLRESESKSQVTRS